MRRANRTCPQLRTAALVFPAKMGLVMLQIVVWALLTGGVTGAVWVGIVLLQREPARPPARNAETQLHPTPPH